MPIISMNTTGVLSYSEDAGWKNPGSTSDTAFGYSESDGCRAISYQFTCPTYQGSGKTVKIAVPIYFPSGGLIVQNFNISVTRISPAYTNAYNSRSLGEDPGRIGTVSERINRPDLQKEIYEFEVPVTELVPGANYFVVISASEGLSIVTTVGMARLSVFYHPMPSTVTVPRNKKLYLGDEILISINRYSTDVNHKITYMFGDETGTILDDDAGLNGVVWTPPMSLGNQIPNTMVDECTLACETILNGELVGTTTIKFMLYVPSTGFKPSVDDVTLTPVSDNSVVSGWNAYVKGFSKVRVSVSASALYGAGLSSCKVKIGDDEALNDFSVTSDILNTSGVVPIHVTVTDTRGQQDTYTTQIYVYPYSRPALTNIICHRSDDIGSYSMDGESYFAQAGAKFSSVGGRNTFVIETRFKTVGGEYSEAETLGSNIGAVCGAGALSPYRTYVVQIAIRDALNTTPYTVPIPEERNTFKIKDGGRGIGIGVIPTEDDLLDVGFDARFQSEVKIDKEWPKITFSVFGMVVGEIGSYSDGHTDGDMYLRVYNASGAYKEYTWSAS